MTDIDIKSVQQEVEVSQEIEREMATYVKLLGDQEALELKIAASKERLVELFKKHDTKTVKAPHLGCSITLAERQKIKFNYSSLEPMLKSRGLYERCLTRKPNLKLVTEDFLRQHGLIDLVSETKFDEEVVLAMIQSRELDLVELHQNNMLEDDTSYTIQKRQLKSESK